jgi:hypothetical protein
MKCTHCRFEYSVISDYCSECGARSPTQNNRLADTHDFTDISQVFLKR